MWRVWADRHSLFIRLLVPYLLFMVLAILIGWLLYRQTLELVSRESSSSNMQLLQQAQDTIDRRLTEIDTMSTQIAREPKVMGFQQIRDPFAGANTFKVIDTQQSLFNYNVSNNFVFDYYLFFRHSELALSSETTYQLPRFYDQLLSYMGLPYADWKQTLFTQYHVHEFMPARDVLYRGKPTRMITYMQSLGTPGQIQGAIAIMINEQQLAKQLGKLDLSDGGYAAIVDADGQVISAVSAEGAVNTTAVMQQGIADIWKQHGSGERQGVIHPSTDNGDRMMTYTVSAYNGWTYLVAQPPHIVMGKVLYIKKVTIAVVFAFLLIGALLAYVFAHRVNQPLKKIISTMPSEQEGVQPMATYRRVDDVYHSVQHMMLHMADRNTELRQELERQAPFLREMLFERLLRGDFRSRQEMDEWLERHQLMLEADRYTVGIIHFGQRDMPDERRLHELEQQREMIKHSLRQAYGENCFYSDLSEDRLAVLLTGYEEAAAGWMLEERLQYWCELLCREHPQAHIQACAVGGIYDSVMDMPRAYDEARQVLMSEQCGGADNISWYRAQDQEQVSYLFATETENRLIHVTRAGELEELQRMLEQLEQDNFHRRRLPLAIQQLLLYELVGCLVKVQPQASDTERRDIQSLFRDIHALTHPSAVYHRIAERLMGLCSHANERKRSRNDRLLDEMMEYVQQRYDEPELCLDMIADAQGISKVYVSQFFKEQTGMNFSDYLEQQRMTRARQLLGETSISVRDIAKQTGYHSSNTFCRAFKRIHGLSATAYRSNPFAVDHKITQSG